MIDVLDPTFEQPQEAWTPAPRPTTLTGITVGIVSNGKAGTRLFFDHLERILRREWGVADVVRRTKSNYSAPADVELIEEAARWQVMVAGVGD
jgi:hypothetical protein